MVKVISATMELTDDVDKAIYWYRNEPIADYGYRTAAPSSGISRTGRRGEDHPLGVEHFHGSSIGHQGASHPFPDVVLI